MFHRSDLPRFDRYRKSLQELANLSEADFLGGPGRPEEDILIDPIFASPLEQVLKDCGLPDHAVAPPHSDTDAVLVLRHDDITYCSAMNDDGYEVGLLALTSEGRVAAAYTGCCLATSSSHTSRGIATRLVMLRFLEDEYLPLWEHDKPGFTPSGHAVHIRAFHELLSLT